MRKLTAIFIALALIMAVAVACGKDGDETTTSQTIGTQYNPMAQSTTESAVTADAPSVQDAAAYVLTTNSQQTVPWVSTTRFEISDMMGSTGNAQQGTEALSTQPGVTQPVTQSGNADYNISFNVSEIAKPEVNTSVATTLAGTTSNGKDNTDPTKETKPNEGAEAVQLLVNSYAYGDGVVYVEVDPSNWNGNFAAANQSITVKVNGTPLGTSATCSVPSKKTGGSYEIKIDLSAHNIEPGSVIDFTIPTGVVKNQSGSQYNLSYSASVSV